MVCTKTPGGGRAAISTGRYTDTAMCRVTLRWNDIDDRMTVADVLLL